MTLTTLNPGLDPIHVESGINTFITRNGTSPCQHIPVTDVPSERSSKWSTPMWVKNIIPNVVWINGDIYMPAPSLLKLGYHRSIDAYYLLPTTRELPKRSTLWVWPRSGTNSITLINHNTPMPLFLFLLFYCSLSLCFPMDP